MLRSSLGDLDSIYEVELLDSLPQEAASAGGGLEEDDRRRGPLQPEHEARNASSRPEVAELPWRLLVDAGPRPGEALCMGPLRPGRGRTEEAELLGSLQDRGEAVHR